MGLKRFLLLPVLILALVSAGVVVSNALALAIADDPCSDAAGQGTNTCPPGTVGVAYSIKFHEATGSGCGPGQQTFYLDTGALPPGLTLATSGTLSGTPTQAGTFKFFIEMREPQGKPSCNGDRTQRQFTLVINPGVPALPKLTLGPESAAPATTGVPYSLQMTATVSDAKTWSISSGALPPGLAINSSTGLISGTPTTAGTYGFTVYAKMNADSRSDTKALGIVVRDPLRLVMSEPPFVASRARGEVTVPFDASIEATGGFGAYTWSVSTGTVPPGLTLTDGAITGTPTTAGSYAFIVSVTDAEGRNSKITARIVVAEKLSISTIVLRPGKVGKLYAAKLKTSGGVKPAAWRIFRGPLPRGIRFDRTLGTLAGTPKTPGRYRVTFEATDALGVRAAKKLAINVLL